jgi:hypothetical protein
VLGAREGRCKIGEKGEEKVVCRGRDRDPGHVVAQAADEFEILLKIVHLVSNQFEESEQWVEKAAETHEFSNA